MRFSRLLCSLKNTGNWKEKTVMVWDSKLHVYVPKTYLENIKKKEELKKK